MSETKSSPIRVRFSPSPTGELHLGSARTALFDHLFAKGNNGIHILRVEDTDQSRYVAGSMDRFLADLAWLGIVFDEGPQGGGEHGPYIQSERTPLYQEAAQQLLGEGHAYKCWCTPERLTQMREAQMAAKQAPRYDRYCLNMSEEQRVKSEESDESFVVRMKIPDGTTVFTDLVRGEVRVENKEIDDQVLLKSDGYPTYHLANIVDDHAMQISHVFRAEEWLPSTPKHIILYQMFGWQPPIFAHLPMVLNKERRKLSKRKDGEMVWISTYRRQGYLPEAMVNYLAFLGWNPGDEREFFTLDELIREFSVERVHPAGAIFDPEKLRFYNAHYLRQLSDEAIVQKLRDGDFLTPELSASHNDLLARWVHILRDRVEILGDFEPNIWSLRHLEDYPAERLIFKKSDLARSEAGLQRVSELFEAASDTVWVSQETLQETLAQAVTDDLTNGDVFWPTRVALSGLEASPSPTELLWVLGREESLKRLATAREKLTL